MTTHDRDKVIAAAKEAGCAHASLLYDIAEKIEELRTLAFEAGRQAEREECAKVCEEHAMYGKDIPSCGKVTQRSMNIIFKVAKAIRARGEGK